MNSFTSQLAIEVKAIALLKSLGNACNHLDLSKRQLAEALKCLESQDTCPSVVELESLSDGLEQSIAASIQTAIEAEQVISQWITRYSRRPAPSLEIV